MVNIILFLKVARYTQYETIRIQDAKPYQNSLPMRKPHNIKEIIRGQTLFKSLI